MECSTRAELRSSVEHAATHNNESDDVTRACVRGGFRVLDGQAPLSI